jgi:hypothetical protein
MKDTDYINKEEAETKQISSESPKESLDKGKNNMLKSSQDLGDGAYESLLQNDHQRLIAQYYFGKFNTHAKRLYYQVIGKPRNYG